MERGRKETESKRVGEAYGLEGSYIADSVVWRNVVDCHALVLLKISIFELLDPLEGPISGSVVECCGPVVTEIFQ
jgi:hypothetical protein